MQPENSATKTTHLRGVSTRLESLRHAPTFSELPQATSSGGLCARCTNLSTSTHFKSTSLLCSLSRPPMSTQERKGMRTSLHNRNSSQAGRLRALRCARKTRSSIRCFPRCEERTPLEVRKDPICLWKHWCRIEINGSFHDLNPANHARTRNARVAKRAFK